MKIEPRKESDRGGWLCMPLLASVPEGKEGWEKVRCPVCEHFAGKDRRMQARFAIANSTERVVRYVL